MRNKPNRANQEYFSWGDTLSFLRPLSMNLVKGTDSGLVDERIKLLFAKGLFRSNRDLCFFRYILYCWGMYLFYFIKIRRKNMKRLFALILVVLMLLSSVLFLSACGDDYDARDLQASKQRVFNGTGSASDKHMVEGFNRWKNNH